MSDYMFMLDSHLNSEQSKVLALVRDQATSAALNLFLTGGAMRDMLGGFPIRDLDFTLEGNAIKFAKTVAAASDAASPTEALRAIIGGFSRWHAEHHQLGRIVQFEFRHLSLEHQAEVIDLRKEIDRVVADVLRDGVESGELDVEDVPTTALALLSMAIDVARWYRDGVRWTPEQIAEQYAEMALRIVGAAG